MLKRKLTCLLIVLSLLASTLLPALKVQAAEISASGKCGENATWELDSSGTLTISGTGAMEDYAPESTSPWYTQRYSIQKVIIEDGITSIGTWAFYGCSGLTGVTIPSSVTDIGEGAFSDCSKLTEMLIPEGVTSIGAAAFKYCDGLTGVYLPNSLQYIGDVAFGQCYNLESTEYENALYLGNPQNPYILLISRGRNADSTSFRIHPDTKFIDANLFINSDLTEITIPEGVRSIGSMAFYGCTELKEVTLPSSLVLIGSSAFGGCTGLKDVYYTGTEAQWKKIEVKKDNEPLANATIHYNYVPVSDGWKWENGAWYYYQGGVKQTGWQFVGNAWYYLNDSGVMQTGWQFVGNAWYYLNSSGAMQTGWLSWGSIWYYLKDNGAMAYGETLNIGGTYYSFDASGVWYVPVAKDGWERENGTWYYYQSGAMQTGWLDLDGTWYFLNDSGVWIY